MTATPGKKVLSTRPIFIGLLTPNNSNAGYCFVEFTTPEAATRALGLNGQPVPNSNRVFKLNWASGGGLVDRR